MAGNGDRQEEGICLTQYEAAAVGKCGVQTSLTSMGEAEAGGMQELKASLDSTADPVSTMTGKKH